MRWHFYVTPPAGGAYNMALDEALMRRASRTGDAVFRVYGWSAPTLSLGRNQRARGAYDEAGARTLGVTFVRRPTGGRALLHDHEVTYSVTMPASDQPAAAAYDFINEVLLRGLEGLGVSARRAEGSSMPPGLRPCFDVPSEHEIVLNGRKLVGSAQWRHAGGLLQHGSILVRDDQALIARIMTSAMDPFPPAGTLREALGREPSSDEVASALHLSLRRTTSSAVEDLVPERALLAEATAIQATYEDNEWTWRR